MFLVAITRVPLKTFPSERTVAQIRLPTNQILTIFTDEFWTSSDDARSFYVSELGADTRVSPNSSNIGVDKCGHSVILSKSLMSGTPIYYYLNSDRELFCSTHISMLQKAGVPTQENTDALPEFFVYRYVTPPGTLFKAIKQVLAGSQVHMRYHGDGYELATINNYEPPVRQDGKDPGSVEDIARRTLSILDESLQPLTAIKDRTAFLLSGGLDSSILFKACQDTFNIDTTFSTAWPLPPGQPNIEKHYASSAAHSFGIRHVHYETTVEDYLYGMLDAIAAAEEPVHHLQSVLLYLLFKKGLPASKHTVISGEGADGLFGSSFNYTLFRGDRLLFRMLLWPPIFNLLRAAAPMHTRLKHLGRLLEKANGKKMPVSDPNNPIWSIGAYGSHEWTRRFFSVSAEDIIKGRYESVKRFEGRSVYDIVSLLGVFGEACVTKAIWSKLAEQQRRIVYYPYHSTKMLDYVYTIPWVVKLTQPKHVLRHIAAQLGIPEFVITRPKSGLGVAPDHWALPGGWFEALIPLVEQSSAKMDLRELQSADPNKAGLFWNVLNYSIWRRLIINKERLEDLRSELRDSIMRVSSRSCRHSHLRPEPSQAG